jgi:hypothetical protein
MKRCLLLIALIPSLCFAQDVRDWQSELTSPAPGPHPKLVPTVLDLQVSWKGMIQSGVLKIEFAPADAKKPGAYLVRSSATSLGAAAVLFPYQSHFWSELDPASFQPRFFKAVEIDKKETVTTTVTTTVRHFADRAVTHEVAIAAKTKVAKTTDKTFKFAPVFDIFSAMLHIRSQNLATGDKLAFVVCPFKTPYLLRVKVAGRELHEGRKAIRLTLGMRKIDRDTLKLQPYKKLKKDATLWLSDDADRVPIELRAAAFIGDVRARLTAHRKP